MKLEAKERNCPEGIVFSALYIRRHLKIINNGCQRKIAEVSLQ